MSKVFYLPQSESKKILWIENFANKLPNYATKYGISPDVVADVQLGAQNYVYWIGVAFQQGEYSKNLTSFKNDLANGTTGTLTAPITPVLGPAPTLVPSGIFKRTSIVVDTIKKSLFYVQNDGLDLGIEGALIPARDMSTLKPVISARIVTDGRPEIVWTKGSTDGIEIQVDKGNGKRHLAVFGHRFKTKLCG